MKTFGYIMAALIIATVALVASSNMEVKVDAKVTDQGKQTVRKGVAKANEGLDKAQRKLSETLDEALSDGLAEK